MINAKLSQLLLLVYYLLINQNVSEISHLSKVSKISRIDDQFWIIIELYQQKKILVFIRKHYILSLVAPEIANQTFD